MTSAQWTVLTLLLITAGIEILFSPITGTLAYSVFTGKLLTTGTVDKSQPLAGQLASPAIAAIGFTIGAVLLLWLAAGVPNLAIALAVAILLLVIFRYAGDILNITSSTPTAQKGASNG